MAYKHISQLHYPLDWPIGFTRTEEPTRGRFDQTLHSARLNLEAELDRFGAEDIIISTNIVLNGNGSPAATGKSPEDAGVAVFFTMDGKEYVFACDRWDLTQHNLHAIGLTVGALRGIDRWGASDIINRAFQGFLALPASTLPIAQEGRWWQILGVSEKADAATIKKAIRSKKALYHPEGKQPDPVKWNGIMVIEEQLTQQNKLQ